MGKNDSNGVITKIVGPARNDTERDARTTGTALVWVLVIGFLFAVSWRPTFWAASCLWGGACALVGMLLGFLFGIPRFIARAGVPSTSSVSTGQLGGLGPAGAGQQQPPGQVGAVVSASQQQPPGQVDASAGAGQQQPSGQVGASVGAGQQQPPGQVGASVGAGQQRPPGQVGASVGAGQRQPPGPGGAAAGVGQQQIQAGVNTNLEEISDWLTKIIVGVSLVELNKAQMKLQQIAGFIAESFGGPGQVSFAYGLMVYFSVAGFLGSYLLTRLYLQKAFRDAAAGL